MFQVMCHYLLFYYLLLCQLKFRNSQRALKNHSQMEHFLRDYICGNIAGWSIVTFGQPFDYVKTLSQLSRPIIYSDLMSIKKFSTFYRGSSGLYLLGGTITSLQFLIYENACKFFTKFLPNFLWKNFEIDLDLKHDENAFPFLSGALTGIALSFIYTPLEYAKIQTQISNQEKPQGSLSRLYKLFFKNKNGFSQAYTGLKWTLTREIPGSALYFGGYHFLLLHIWEQQRTQASVVKQAICGSIAGVTAVLYIYPFDLIKTNVQSHSRTFEELRRAKIWKQTYFRRGLYSSLLRSVITDAISFVTFQRTRAFLINQY